MKIYSVCAWRGGGASDGRFQNCVITILIIGGCALMAERPYQPRDDFSSEFNTVVSDEADRMLDMGFIDEMRFCHGGDAQRKTDLVFPATLSPTIEKLRFREFLSYSYSRFSSRKATLQKMWTKMW